MEYYRQQQQHRVQQLRNNQQLSSTYCQQRPTLEKQENDETEIAEEQDKTVREDFQKWAEKTYKDCSKTRTITAAKYQKIVNTIKGEIRHCAENSKFRFWMKCKGFVLAAAGSINTDDDDDRKSIISNTKDHLYVLDKKNSETKYKKVAVVEDFFDIIYNTHVTKEVRGIKHAGQKRTHRSITKTYAFLPREAVTKFLSCCSVCNKRSIPLSTDASRCADSQRQLSSNTTTRGDGEIALFKDNNKVDESFFEISCSSYDKTIIGSSNENRINNFRIARKNCDYYNNSASETRNITIITAAATNTTTTPTMSSATTDNGTTTVRLTSLENISSAMKFEAIKKESSNGESSQQIEAMTMTKSKVARPSIDKTEIINRLTVDAENRIIRTRRRRKNLYTRRIASAQRNGGHYWRNMDVIDMINNFPSPPDSDRPLPLITEFGKNTEEISSTENIESEPNNNNNDRFQLTIQVKPQYSILSKYGKRNWISKRYV